ncbi:hypothetical protein KM043_008442 [Ampulex compressa]|nr:hypothetical protein KM043_008442 [Ampulex compressa]
MLQRPFVELKVTIVGNPSMTVEEATIPLKNIQFPDVCELFADVAFHYLSFLTAFGETECFVPAGLSVEAICSEQPFRIYWRASEQDYMPINSFITLKGSLNLIYTPRMYVVTDERPLAPPGFSGNQLPSSQKQQNNKGTDGRSDATSDYDMSSVYAMTDIELLQRADCQEEQPDDPFGPFRCLFLKTPAAFTRERRDVDRQLNILMKGFPRAKLGTVEDAFPESRKIEQRANGKRSMKK